LISLISEKYLQINYKILPNDLQIKLQLII